MIYIKKLVVKKFYKLDDFELEFDEFKPITVFIGKNGSGKSTILEAITRIFGALHLYVENKEPSLIDFDFEIIYYVVQSEVLDKSSMSFTDKNTYIEVYISRLSSNENEFKVSIGNNSENTFFNIPNPQSLIPNLVIYYSGFSENLYVISKLFSDDYRQNLRKVAQSSIEANSKIKLSPVFYVESMHYQILLATLLSYEYNINIDDFLSTKFGFRKIDNRETGVAIRVFVNKKQYVKGKSYEDFWGADGEIGLFLKRLREISYQELWSNSKDDNNGMIYCFRIDDWYKLREQYVEEKNIFILLDMLYHEGLLATIQTVLDMESNTESLDGNRISEGERQLITVKALCEILMEENTLFLMDEADTFQHPSWQEDFIEDIYTYSEINEENPHNRSTFILTTHSPIILSNLKDGNLVKVKNGKTEIIEGHFYGREYGFILEDLMQTNRRNQEIENKLKDIFDLVDSENKKEAQTLINELKQVIGEDPELTKAQTLIDFF